MPMATVRNGIRRIVSPVTACTIGVLAASLVTSYLTDMYYTRPAARSEWLPFHTTYFEGLIGLPVRDDRFHISPEALAESVELKQFFYSVATRIKELPNWRDIDTASTASKPMVHRGWPMTTTAPRYRICITYRSPLRDEILFADRSGYSPNRPMGWICNTLIYSGVYWAAIKTILSLWQRSKKKMTQLSTGFPVVVIESSKISPNDRRVGRRKA